MAASPSGSGMGYDFSLAGSDAKSSGLNNPFSQTDQSLSFGGGAGRLAIGLSSNAIITGLAVLLAVALMAVAIKRRL